MSENKNKSMAERYPRTVTIETFTAWQTLTRSGDSKAIHEKYKISRPIVSRALNYGHVKNPKVTDNINKFFKARLLKEAQGAEELNDLAEAAVNPTA